MAWGIQGDRLGRTRAAASESAERARAGGMATGDCRQAPDWHQTAPACYIQAPAGTPAARSRGRRCSAAHPAGREQQSAGNLSPAGPCMCDAGQRQQTSARRGSSMLKLLCPYFAGPGADAAWWKVHSFPGHAGLPRCAQRACPPVQPAPQQALALRPSFLMLWVRASVPARAAICFTAFCSACSASVRKGEGSSASRVA